MIFNLNELNIKDVILFNEKIEKNEKLDKRIHDLKDASAVGRVYIDSVGDIMFECHFKGIMFIEDSITLENVPYAFEINIEENVNDLKENYDNCYKSRQNTLDLIEVLWQNIVLEVPISYTKVLDANLKGNGWELQNKEKKSEIDPRLKKLEDLLKGDD